MFQPPIPYDFQDVEAYQRNSMAYVKPVATHRIRPISKYALDHSSKMVKVRAITNRIEAIHRLQNNWDGYGAITPTHKVFQNTYLFLNLLPIDISLTLLPDNISPTPYGTLQLDWQKNNALLSVEIGTSKIAFFSEFPDQSNPRSDGYLFNGTKIALDLVQAINRFFAIGSPKKM
ncbi:MAG: hypothetical protein ACKVUS_06685 [Saprospiraceae bacterium]